MIWTNTNGTWNSYSLEVNLNITEETIIIIYYHLTEINIQIKVDTGKLEFPAKVIINGIDYHHNSIAYISDGTYDLSCLLSENYNFTSWEVEGSIAVASTTTTPTTITVSGDGTLTLWLKNISPYLWWFERTNAWIGIGAGFGMIFLPLLGCILIRREDDLATKLKIIFCCGIASLILCCLLISWLYP